jgi:Protein of unknown function (DUF2782)
MSNARFRNAILSGALLALASTAFAQSTPKGLEPLPDIPPPPRLSNTPITPADADDAPSVTIRQEGENKVEEFRTKGGRVYAVRVTPRFGKPYLLVDPDTKGPVPDTTELNGGTRAAQWTLFEF